MMRTVTGIRSLKYKPCSNGDPCWVCGKQVKNPRYGVRVVSGGNRFLHKDDQDEWTDESSDLGLHYVGPECAKMIDPDYVIDFGERP